MAQPASSPFRLLATVVAAVGVMEFTVMLVLRQLGPDLPYMAEAVFDAAVLMLVLGPVLWLFVVRPFTHQIRAREEAEGRLWLVQHDLERRIADRTAALEEANQTLEAEAAERRRTSEALQAARDELAERVLALQALSAEMTGLREMGELLQTSGTIAEARHVITPFGERLFPGTTGAVYVLNASRTLLESAGAWGPRGAALDDCTFAPDECWGLRRGQPHLANGAERPLNCTHTDRSPGRASVCVPMMARGGTIGLLHLASEGQAGPDAKLLDRMARPLAEQLSLGLANIQLRETLRDQSIRDTLTGLHNRRFLEETLEKECARAVRYQRSLALLLLDLDHFKRFNDTHGHEAGDLLLTELGHAIRSRLRTADTACRLGGEEFVVLLPDTGLEAAQTLAEQIRLRVADLRLRMDGRPLGEVTVSIGVAATPDHGGSGRMLLRTADGAMYQAKSQGRNQVVVAEPTLSLPLAS